MRLAALTAPQPVRGYATVGVTWKHGVELRRGPDRRRRYAPRRTATGPAGSTAAYHGEHGPDAGTPRRRPRASARARTRWSSVTSTGCRCVPRHGRQHPARPRARRHRPGHRADDQAGPGDRHLEAAPSTERRARDRPGAGETSRCRRGEGAGHVALSAMKRPRSPRSTRVPSGVPTSACATSRHRLRHDARPASSTTR